MSNTARTRIVILGGGFGGIYAALRLEKALASDPALEVTLVNRENFFLFTPMLHEVAASDLDMTDIVSVLSKLPRFEKKVRVALDWMLDVVFSKDLVQIRTLRAPTMSQAENGPRSPAALVSHV